MALKFPEEMPLDFIVLEPLSSEENTRLVIEEMVDKAVRRDDRSTRNVT